MSRVDLEYQNGFWVRRCCQLGSTSPCLLKTWVPQLKEGFPNFPKLLWPEVASLGSRSTRAHPTKKESIPRNKTRPKLSHNRNSSIEVNTVCVCVCVCVVPLVLSCVLYLLCCCLCCYLCCYMCCVSCVVMCVVPPVLCCMLCVCPCVRSCVVICVVPPVQCI